MVIASAKTDGPPADQTLRDTKRVMEAVHGHWLSACLGVLMKLKIPEILASAGENTMSFAEVYYVAAWAPHLMATMHTSVSTSSCHIRVAGGGQGRRD